MIAFATTSSCSSAYRRVIDINYGMRAPCDGRGERGQAQSMLPSGTLTSATAQTSRYDGVTALALYGLLRLPRADGKRIRMPNW
jgi:hypothetical protein